MQIKQILKKGQTFMAAKGLVFIDDSYVLVFERDNNTTCWPDHDDLPGGTREGKETPFETFQRELREEFDLDVEPSDISYAVKHQDIGVPTSDAYFMVANLKCSTRKQITFGQDEGRGYHAVHLDNLLTDYNFIPGYKDLVKEYLEYAENHRHPLRNNRGHLTDHLSLA